ncbi:MAG: PhzF family phenazine biosynthesis protein [Gammaproteobacteria bacterium]|nr:PhzF family phenazine biosynthesis protein [Gammaproteobacteria bacterium]
MECPYYLIDVFTSQKFEGAQIAVFPQANALTEQKMQLLARELNLSETVFLCTATDGTSSTRLRIFTPQTELGFAGHPIIAAGYVMREIHAKPVENEFIQIGSVSLLLNAIAVKDETRVVFTLKTTGKLDNFVPSTTELGEILHLDANVIEQATLQPMLVNCSGEYLVIPVKTVAAFNDARFNINKWTTSFVATLASKIVLCCRVRPEDQVPNYRVRLLGKGIDVNDDPPVGSAAPAMGMYLFAEKEDGIFHAILQRGGDGKRKSLIELTLKKTAGKVDDIQIGGHAVKAGAGVIYLD